MGDIPIDFVREKLVLVANSFLVRKVYAHFPFSVLEFCLVVTCPVHAVTVSV